MVGMVFLSNQLVHARLVRKEAYASIRMPTRISDSLPALTSSLKVTQRTFWMFVQRWRLTSYTLYEFVSNHSQGGTWGEEKDILPPIYIMSAISRMLPRCMTEGWNCCRSGLWGISKKDYNAKAQERTKSYKCSELLNNTKVDFFTERGLNPRWGILINLIFQLFT